jgi:hypothetical protein
VSTAFALGAVALAAQLLGGCAGLSPTPYNGRESCDGVGGIYTADGRCLGGSASLDAGAGAGGAAPGILELELGYGAERPVDLPLPPRPDVGADTAQALQEMKAREQAQSLGRAHRPDPTHRPDLDHDVTQGIQSRGLDRAIGR